MGAPRFEPDRPRRGRPAAARGSVGRRRAWCDINKGFIFRIFQKGPYEDSINVIEIQMVIIEEVTESNFLPQTTKKKCRRAKGHGKETRKDDALSTMGGLNN